jgi:hypothetical protein
MVRHNRDGDDDDKPSRVDRTLLQDGSIVEQFQAAFRGAFEVRQGDGDNSYEPVLKALKSASEVLATDEKPEPGWFAASGGLMRLAIEKIDQRQQAYNEHPTAAKKASLKKAKREVKIAKRTAVNRWHEHVLEKVHALNGRHDAEGVDDNGRPLTMKAIWRNIKLLIRGRSNFEKTSTMRLKRPDGSLSESMEENTEIMRKYLCGVFAKNGTFDPTAIGLVRQRKVRHWMDRRPPSEEEILLAVKKITGEAVETQRFPQSSSRHCARDTARTTRQRLRKLVLRPWCLCTRSFGKLVLIQEKQISAGASEKRRRAVGASLSASAKRSAGKDGISAGSK